MIYYSSVIFRVAVLALHNINRRFLQQTVSANDVADLCKAAWLRRLREANVWKFLSLGQLQLWKPDSTTRETLKRRMCNASKFNSNFRTREVCKQMEVNKRKTIRNVKVCFSFWRWRRWTFCFQEALITFLNLLTPLKKRFTYRLCMCSSPKMISVA